MKRFFILVIVFINFPALAEISWRGFSPSDLKSCMNRFEPEPECTSEMSDVYGDMVIEFNNCQVTQFLNGNKKWMNPKLSDCSDIYPSDEDLQKIDVGKIDVTTTAGRDKLWLKLFNKNEVNANDFFGEDVDSEAKKQEYKLEIEIPETKWYGIITRNGQVEDKKDIIKELMHASIITLRSMSDVVPIASVVVNRGNCEAYPLVNAMKNAPYIIYDNGNFAIGLPTFTSQIDLKFSNKLHVLTNCSSEDIREVEIQTPTKKITYAYRN